MVQCTKFILLCKTHTIVTINKMKLDNCEGYEPYDLIVCSISMVMQIIITTVGITSYSKQALIHSLSQRHHFK
jgi:hypothetical protein